MHSSLAIVAPQVKSLPPALAMKVKNPVVPARPFVSIPAFEPTDFDFDILHVYR